jgi:hypothetical protein
MAKKNSDIFWDEIIHLPQFCDKDQEIPGFTG